MSTKIISLPVDARSHAIQALAVDETTHTALTITGTASAYTLPTLWEVFELNLSVDCHVKFGAAAQSAATTSSRFLPAGSYVYARQSAQVEISIIKAAGASDGVGSIARLI